MTGDQPARIGLTLALLLAALRPGSATADIAAITSQNADMLSLIDTDTLGILATLPLPGKPAAVALDGLRGRVLTVAVDTRRLHVFDLTGQAIGEWPLPGSPFGVAIVPDSGMALITDMDGGLVEVDPATGQTLRRWATGALPSGVAAAVDWIVIANRDDNSVSVITKEDQRSIVVGEHPFGITLRDGRAFVTNVLSDSVSVIDLASARVIATLPVGERPYAVAFAGGKGFVTNQYASSLSVFDAANLVPLGEIATDDYPEGIAATADESRLFVANWFSDTVQVIDPVTQTVIKTLDMPEGPRAFGNFIGLPPAD